MLIENHLSVSASKLLAIFFSLLILGQAYVIKRAVGTYIFPACLFLIAWFLYTFIPLVTLFNVPVNPLAILYILICLSAFSMGALPFNWVRAFNDNKLKTLDDSTKLNSRFMRVVFIISVISSIVFSTLMKISSGISYEYVFLKMMESSDHYAHMRGHGKLGYSIYGILGIFFTYLTPLIGGLLTVSCPEVNKKIKYLVITFVPVLYFMLAQSSKIVMFYSIGFYLAAFLLGKIHSNSLHLFNRKFFLNSVIIFLSLFPIIFFSVLSRPTTLESVNPENRILYTVKSYTLAQLYAFSDFFSSYLGQSSLTKYVNDFNSHGAYTFTSLLNLFGFKKLFPPGTYYDSYAYENIIGTNIFTIFRGLINDFGAVGTIVFMFISGLIAHAFFFRLLTKRNSAVASAVFIVMIVYIQGTYLASVFMARYMYLLLLSFAVIYWINDRYYKDRTIK